MTPAILVASLMLQSAPAPAADPIDSAFAQYCAATGSQSTYCADHPPTPRPVKWLVLQSVCPAAATDQPCAGFNAAKDANAPLVLAYNHRASTWHLLAHGPHSIASVEKDANGIPTLYASPSERRMTIIEDTNPLAYGYTLGTVTTAPIGILADLGSVIQGIGSVLSGHLASLGGPGPAAFASPADAPLNTFVASVTDALTNILNALAAVKADVDAVSGTAAALTACTQRIEFDPAQSCADVPTDRSHALPASLDADFQHLSDGVTMLGNLYQCRRVFDAFSTFIDDAAKPDSASASHIALLEQAALPCDPTKAALVALLVDTGDAVWNPGGTPNPTALRTARAYRDRLKGIDPTGDHGILADARLVLAKRTDAVKTRYATDTMLTRFYDHRVGDGWVLPWIVVSPANDEIQWDKIYTYPLDVVVDTPYKDSLTLARGERKTSYKVASARSNLFGAGVGVIYTRLAESTWGAVDNGAGKKVVAATDSATRSGQLAAFIDWRFAPLQWPSARDWAVTPFLQFGAAVSKTPQAFFGGGLQFFKVLRISGGLTNQKFTELDGQTENVTVVSGKDDIKTKDTFRSGAYLGVTFAIDSLSLFKKPS